MSEFEPEALMIIQIATDRMTVYGLSVDGKLYIWNSSARSWDEA